MQGFNPVPIVSPKPDAILGPVDFSTNIQPADVAAELVVEAYFIWTQLFT